MVAELVYHEVMIHQFDADSIGRDFDGIEVFSDPADIPGAGYNPFVYVTYYDERWRAAFAPQQSGGCEVMIEVATVDDAIRWASIIAEEEDVPLVTGGFGSDFSDDCSKAAT